jgi:MFS-type transporter involved in bile tolerance (Atg22 family)
MTYVRKIRFVFLAMMTISISLLFLAVKHENYLYYFISIIAVTIVVSMVWMLSLHCGNCLLNSLRNNDKSYNVSHNLFLALLKGRCIHCGGDSKNQRR